MTFLNQFDRGKDGPPPSRGKEERSGEGFGVGEKRS